MRLVSHPFSPYGRKVKITAEMKAVLGDIKIEQADTMPAVNPELRAANPLSKIPVLILDGGQQIFDSPVICEYLDSLKPAPASKAGSTASRSRSTVHSRTSRRRRRGGAPIPTTDI